MERALTDMKDVAEHAAWPVAALSAYAGPDTAFGALPFMALEEFNLARRHFAPFPVRRSQLPPLAGNYLIAPVVLLAHFSIFFVSDLWLTPIKHFSNSPACARHVP